MCVGRCAPLPLAVLALTAPAADANEPGTYEGADQGGAPAGGGYDEGAYAQEGYGEAAQEGYAGTRRCARASCRQEKSAAARGWALKEFGAARTRMVFS